MSYAAAYSLFNYRFEDPSIGFSEYSNLRMIRAFERGLDPLSSEVSSKSTSLITIITDNTPRPASS